MDDNALVSIQEALLEQALIEVETPKQAPGLSPILTGYLDTLIRSATEVPESLLSNFPALSFTSGNMEFFTPLSRIERIEYAAPFRRRFAYQIPEYIGSGRFMFRIRDSKNWLFFDSIIGLEQIDSAEVIWRGNAANAPWFIGTHRKQLCRIFDPEVLIERQENFD